MSIQMLDNVDFTKNQTLNRVVQNLASAPGSPATGQEFWDTANTTLKFWNGAAWKSPFARADHTGTQLSATISDLAATVQAYRLDQFAVPTSSVNFNNQKITGLANGVSANDAVTFSQASAMIQGMTPKGYAYAATTAALTTTYSNGTAGAGATLTSTTNIVLVVDGATVPVNEPVLVQNQANPFENGLYLLTQAGVAGTTPFILTRATNMDVSAKFEGAMIVVDITSTTQGGALYLCNQVAPTVGTTNITFTRINTASSYSADGVTMTLTGSTFSIKTTYVGQTSITTLGTITSGVWTGTSVAVANGGTGASTPAGARANLGATTKFATNIGNASATSFVVNHALGTADVQVKIYDNTSKNEVFMTQVYTDANNVTLSCSVAPATNGLRVIVIG